jgi:preprotein translocase subunit SecF
MFAIVPRSRQWFLLSGTLVFLSLMLLLYPGLNIGIDFTGGSLLEISVAGGVEKEQVASALQTLAQERQWDLGEVTVLKTHSALRAGEAEESAGFLLRMRELTNEQRQELLTFLQASFGAVKEVRFTTIGPTVGRSLKLRSLWALATAALGMILYIAFAFRNIPRKLNPWKFGVIAVIALVHDILITTGTFVLLGLFTSFEVSNLFVTALLIIIGYSVNDTIVIFDRIREKVFLQQRGEDFAEVAEQGLQETLARSVHTSATTLTPLAVLFFLGGESIRWFVLTLFVGISVGTYSSIFIAAPLLVAWRRS